MKAAGVIGRLREVLSDRGVHVRDRYGISIPRQALGLLTNQWRFGMGRAEYYMFELYRADLTPADRQSFLSQSAWTALSSVINHPTQKADDSKLWLSHRFTQAGLPIPKTLAYTAPAPRDQDRQVTEFVPLEKLPQLIPRNGCVIKADHSTWGLGVHVFDGYDNGVFRCVDGRGLTLEALRSELLKQPGRYWSRNAWRIIRTSRR